jgi:hypothetical protein
MKAKMMDVLEAFEMSDDELHYVYNKKTGEVVVVADASSDFESDEDVDMAELEENEEQYIALPDKFDINDYHIMEQFIWHLPAGEQQTELERSIQGRGAFRYFRNTLDRFEMTQKWYDFQNEAYREMAVEWGKVNGVELVE